METGWITRKFTRVVSILVALGWLVTAWGMQQTRPTFVMIGLGIVLLGLLPFLFVSWIARYSWWFNNALKDNEERDQKRARASFEEIPKDS